MLPGTLKNPVVPTTMKRFELPMGAIGQDMVKMCSRGWSNVVGSNLVHVIMPVDFVLFYEVQESTECIPF